MLDVPKVIREDLEGEVALWISVLLRAYSDILTPGQGSATKEAMRFIFGGSPSSNFDICADALNLEPENLRKRILKSLLKKGVQGI